eukprot:scaffold202611_cov31-Prasinocladus_malaysianus.AAC.1
MSWYSSPDVWAKTRQQSRHDDEIALWDQCSRQVDIMLNCFEIKIVAKEKGGLRQSKPDHMWELLADGFTSTGLPSLRPLSNPSDVSISKTSLLEGGWDSPRSCRPT